MVEPATLPTDPASSPRTAATTKGSADAQSSTMPAVMRIRPSQSTGKAYRAGVGAIWSTRCPRSVLKMSRWPITGAGTAGRGVAGQPIPALFSMLPKGPQSLDQLIGSSPRTPDKYRRTDIEASRHRRTGTSLTSSETSTSFQNLPHQTLHLRAGPASVFLICLTFRPHDSDYRLCCSCPEPMAIGFAGGLQAIRYTEFDGAFWKRLIRGDLRENVGLAQRERREEHSR